MAPACNRHRVLLVDGEPSFRESVAAMLTDDGHEVLAYADPRLLPPLQSLGEVGVLVTDYDMPGRSGLALADEFHRLHPSVPILMISADRSPTLQGEVAHRAFLRLATKPISYDDLHDLIHDEG